MFIWDLGTPYNFVAWFFLAIGLPATLWLFLLGLASLLPTRRVKTNEARHLRIAVVIPAHNETLMIFDTVKGVFEQDYPKEAFTLMVVADNCIDDTADKARAAGARVLERSSNPGKGQALLETFGVLLEEDWDALLVVDADTRLHPNLLRTLSRELADGAGAIQAYYGVLNPSESRRTMAMELALASFNGLRPRGKTNLGMSAGLFGNGFCLSRDTLEKVPYQAGSVVEDLEYHLQLLEANIKVRFVDDVQVTAQMPASRADATSQRVRWEQGRMKIMTDLMPSMLGRFIRFKPGALESLIDVCIPPVSSIALCLVAAFALGSPTLQLIAFSALVMVVFHYTLGALRFGSLKRMFLVMGYVPYYFIWKTWTVFSSMLARANSGWVRTKRH